jgi:hypothetical protein
MRLDKTHGLGYLHYAQAGRGGRKAELREKYSTAALSNRIFSMSAVGQFRTRALPAAMSALPLKADIAA